MFVIKYKKFFITLSIVFVTLSLLAVLKFGLTLGIDFTGGSQLQVSYTEGRPEIENIKEALTRASLPEATVQPTGENAVIIKSHILSESEKNQVVKTLGAENSVVEESFTTIGPSVGRELKNKAIISIILSLIAIICFVAYAFRKVSEPVSSWKYGVAVIIPLIHDILIPIGVFSVIGHYYGAELDTLFVVALLTTLSISIADTIVVFDRVRENLGNDTKKNSSFPAIVGQSLNETFARSINTSLMVLVMVVTLAIFGPSSTKLFAIVLSIGMFFGTYSSIFIASPILILFEEAQNKKFAKKK